MTAGIGVACGIGALLAAVNAATTRRLWASKIFERPQKIAQTALLWLVPGSFLAVRHVLGEERGGHGVDGSELTAHGSETEYDHGAAGMVGGHHFWDSWGGSGEGGEGGSFDGGGDVGGGGSDAGGGD